MNNLAILVLSCDKYSFVWKSYFQNFWKMWGDCPYKIYLLTNEEKYGDQRITSLQIGPDTTWGNNLIKALDKIEEDFILTTFDDLFLDQTIKTEKIDRMYKIFIEDQMNYLKVNYLRKNELFNYDKSNGIGEIPPGLSYRSSAVFTIWKKSVLRSIVSQDDSAWDFEIKGSKRTDRFDKWFGSPETILPYSNLIIKGKCDPKVFRNLLNRGLDMTSENFILMNHKEAMKYRLKLLRAKLFHAIVPAKMGARFREKYRSS